MLSRVSFVNSTNIYCMATVCLTLNWESSHELKHKPGLNFHTTNTLIWEGNLSRYHIVQGAKSSWVLN